MPEAESYPPIFYNGLLILTLSTCAFYWSSWRRPMSVMGLHSIGLPVLATSVLLFVGLRPISVQFGDMMNYFNQFNLAALTDHVDFRDPVFSWLMLSCVHNLSAEGFFFICSTIYVVPLAIAVQREHGRWAFTPFLAFLGAFSFLPYAVNGIRNGMAASLTILSFSLRANRPLMVTTMLLAIGTHRSVLLPALAFLVAASPRVPSRFWVAAWLVALVVSATFGASVSNFLLPVLGGDDEYMGQYLAEEGARFRPDFIAYSILPVALSAWLAPAEARRDPGYRRLLSTYLASNAIWLLMIYANFSNRFAYLSWLLQPWLLVYPLIPHTTRRGRGAPVTTAPVLRPVVIALLLNILFTYVMMMIVYPGRE